nr:hypothetical protein [Escherichia coli O25b:H4-ST131]
MILNCMEGDIENSGIYPISSLLLSDLNHTMRNITFYRVLS